MTRYKNHFTTLRTQPDRKVKSMFHTRPPLEDRNKEIARQNSGSVHAEMMAKAKEAAEAKLEAERANYEKSEKARLVKRDQEVADAKFKSDVASAIQTAQNQLAGAIALRNIEAAKSAAMELVILERIQH